MKKFIIIFSLLSASITIQASDEWTTLKNIYENRENLLKKDDMLTFTGQDYEIAGKCFGQDGWIKDAILIIQNYNKNISFCTDAGEFFMPPIRSYCDPTNVRMDFAIITNRLGHSWVYGASHILPSDQYDYFFADENRQGSKLSFKLIEHEGGRYILTKMGGINDADAPYCYHPF